MSDSFPFGSTQENLEAKDFLLFANSYRQLVGLKVPSSGKIYFLGEDDPLPKLNSDPRKGTKLSLAITTILQSKTSASCRVADTIIFTYSLNDGRKFIILISLVDPMVVELGTVDWLEETRINLLREFLLIKQAFRDQETGVLNSAHLFTVLQSESTSHPVAVILVELPPRGRALRGVFSNAQQAATILLGFTDSRFLIHHLGQNVFALLVNADEVGPVEDFSSHLVLYCKKEGFSKVHVGCSIQREDANKSLLVLDEAWIALLAAEKRGPFSFCDFTVLNDLAHHPLRPVSREITKSYRKLSKKEPVFCVIHLNIPERDDSSIELTEMLQLPENVSILGIDGGCFLFLSGYDREQGLQFAQTLLVRAADNTGMSEAYAGVSHFPFQGFTRSEMLINARKALLHAGFFDPSHAVLFDAVSLNISGDVYFSDGDLPQAVREYRRGLECDPEDVNLLNSLGVTYALLNKNGAARASFERALEVDPLNYMAYYNLGLGAQLCGEQKEALCYFQKADEHCGNGEEDGDVARDLHLQLGTLYCQTGEYAKSLEYLHEWFVEAEAWQQRRVLRYLGEGYLGIGKPQEAMTWLQRAQNQNQFDHDVLSLLGTAIWQAREGDEIALSLCRKSVDLAPGSTKLRVRLAQIQLHAGMYEEGLANLKLCRPKNTDVLQVQLLKALFYKKLQQYGRARSWAKKVFKGADRGSELYSKAQVLLESMV